MAEKTYVPFDCGTQWHDWSAANCATCVKSVKDGEEFTCDIQEAIFETMCDKEMSEEIAERMGYLDNSPPRQQGFSLNWQCGEWEPTERAKKEYVIRNRTN